MIQVTTFKPRRWTAEDVAFLEDNWGSKSIKAIAKSQKRSIDAIKLKARKLGLGDASHHFDGITVSQLSQVIQTNYSLILNWIEKYNFPVKEKVFSVSGRVRVVTFQDFWKWAKENKEMIDFTRIDRGILGPEPDWVESKRNADKMRKVYIPQPHNTPWSSREIGLLKSMVANGGYSYPEISRHLKRTEGAIKRKLLELNIKYRPERLPNHNKYSAAEEEYLIDALFEGRCFEEIAHKLNRSALGVRGKAERLGFTFKNGVPIRKEVS